MELTLIEELHVSAQNERTVVAQSAPEILKTAVWWRHPWTLACLSPRILPSRLPWLGNKTKYLKSVRTEFKVNSQMLEGSLPLSKK